MLEFAVLHKLVTVNSCKAYSVKAVVVVRSDVRVSAKRFKAPYHTLEFRRYTKVSAEVSVLKVRLGKMEQLPKSYVCLVCCLLGEFDFVFHFLPLNLLRVFKPFCLGFCTHYNANKWVCQPFSCFFYEFVNSAQIKVNVFVQFKISLWVDKPIKI